MKWPKGTWLDKCKISQTELADKLGIESREVRYWTSLQRNPTDEQFEAIAAAIGAGVEELKDDHQQALAEKLHRLTVNLREALGLFEGCTELHALREQIDTLIFRGAKDRPRAHALADYLGGHGAIAGRLSALNGILTTAINNVEGEAAPRCLEIIQKFADAIAMHLVKDLISPTDLQGSKHLALSTTRASHMRAVIDSAIPSVDRLTHVSMRNGRVQPDRRYTRELPPCKSNNVAYRVRQIVEVAAQGSPLSNYSPPQLAAGDDVAAFQHCADTVELNDQLAMQRDGPDHQIAYTIGLVGEDLANALERAGMDGIRIIKGEKPKKAEAELESALNAFIVQIRHQIQNSAKEKNIMSTKYSFGNPESVTIIENANAAVASGVNRGHIAMQHNAADFAAITEMLDSLKANLGGALEHAPDLSKSLEALEEDIRAGRAPEPTAGETLRTRLDSARDTIQTADTTLSLGARVWDMGYRLADKIDLITNVPV